MTAKFGAYEILHELKRGGMGAVLLGRRKGPGSFEQLVAIKTIRPEYASTEAVRAMFLDEAKILGGINHPGIATVHDFGEEAGTLYMVMEYVAGISFRGLLDLQLPPGVAARAIAEACRGLHAAHEVRDIAGNLLTVVHRDISPDNLLLGFDGHVKVIDFGIALIKNRQSPVTEFGTVKGKPPYMSPEQVKNEVLDRRSDVFSLGVVLHELLTGEPLFDGDSIYAIARKVEHAPIQPPSEVRGTPLPAGLDAAVMTALQRDLARRTPTAAAFAEQLEQVIAVAGDETLEAWSERTLADAREQHRAWLAEIVAGRDIPRPVGRATGSVTALGPLAFVDKLPITVPASPEIDPTLPAPIGTSPAPSAAAGVSPPLADAAGDTGDAALDRPPRRGLAPLLIALVALFAVGAAIVFVVTRSRSTTTPPDAPIAVSEVIDAARLDAAKIAEATDASAPPDAVAAIDAATTTIDAAAVVVVAADAGRVPRPIDPRPIDRHPKPPIDAGTTKKPPPDAAPVTPVVAGTGKLRVKHHPQSPTYLEVYVDKQHLGRTPILVPVSLSAGSHTLVLVAPDTGQVVYTTQFTLADGESKTLVQPAPARPAPAPPPTP